MSTAAQPLKLAFLLMIFAGWVHRRQLIVIEFLLFSGSLVLPL